MASASELPPPPPPALLSDGESELELESESEESEINEDEEGDEDEGDEEEEEEDEDVLCLFCTSRFSSPSAALHHCSVDHGFDLARLRERLGLDFYDCMRLINYIRSQVCVFVFFSSISLEDFSVALKVEYNA